MTMGCTDVLMAKIQMLQGVVMVFHIVKLIHLIHKSVNVGSRLRLVALVMFALWKI